MNFDVVKTNIVNLAVDAIVLPANERLKEGSGTSKAIFEAAGRKELTSACKKIGHCDVGSAAITLAFKLNAKYIVHAVVPKWKDGQSNEYELLSSAYLSALNVADMLGCETIAFPILASGNNGFDKDLAVEIAMESIEAYSGTNLKKVLLVAYGNKMEALFKEMGYSVTVVPDTLYKDERKAAHDERMKQLIAEGKDVAMSFVEEKTAQMIEWLKDEKNREKLFQIAKGVAEYAIKEHMNGNKRIGPRKK